MCLGMSGQRKSHLDWVLKDEEEFITEKDLQKWQKVSCVLQSSQGQHPAWSKVVAESPSPDRAPGSGGAGGTQ